MPEITSGKIQYDALDERYGCKEKDIETFFYNAHNLEEAGRLTAIKICNEAGFDGEAAQEKLRKRLDKFLKENFEDSKKAREEFFLNWDPRGYFIKIHADDIPKTNIYMDFGRDGILVPTYIEVNGNLHRNRMIGDMQVW